MNDDIKPCPFCYSEAVIKINISDGDYDYGKKYYDIKCTNIHCYLCSGADWNYPNPEGIIEIWNNRDIQSRRDKILNDLGI
jgi:hypothetical protein